MAARRAYAPRVKGAAALLALLACIAASAGEAQRSPVTVRVMTRNLYLGANLDAIVQAKSTPEAFRAVEKGWGDVRANDFPTRARAIAKEIATAKPDFVGFQELSLYRTQTPAWSDGHRPESRSLDSSPTIPAATGLKPFRNST